MSICKLKTLPLVLLLATVADAQVSGVFDGILSVGSAVATPTYISSVGEAGSQQYPNGGTAEVNQYYFWTTQPMPVGDCAFVYITNASSGAVAGMASVDNAGNIYSVLASSYDATDGGSITMFGAPITNSGANKITVSWTGEQEYVSGGVLVESNVTSLSLIHI